MKRAIVIDRRACAGFLFVALLGSIIFVRPGYGARQTTSRLRAGSIIYTEHEVLRAFASAGDALFDTGYSSAYASPVTVLATIKTHQGWSAAVYVYPSVLQAAESLRANQGQWRAGGISAVEMKNLVVTVILPARRSSGAVTTRALPPLVVKALASISAQAK
jgi:hypothetical protein